MQEFFDFFLDRTLVTCGKTRMLLIDRAIGIEDKRIGQRFHCKTLLGYAAIRVEKSGNLDSLTFDVITDLSHRFDLIGIDSHHGNTLLLKLLNKSLEGLLFLLAGLAPQSPKVHKYRPFTEIRGKR